MTAADMAKATKIVADTNSKAGAPAPDDSDDE
jgi:hypothetical protein